MKRNRSRTLFVMTVCWLASWEAARAATSAADEYERIFGSEEKRVLATPDTKDDAAFGKQLLDAAGEVKDDHDFQAFLYRRAFELSIKDVSGIPTATRAVELLDPLDPNVAKELRQRTLEGVKSLYQKANRQEKEPTAKVYVDQLLNQGDSLAGERKFREAKAAYIQAQTVDAASRGARRSDIQTRLKSLEGQAKLEEKFAQLVAKLKKDPTDQKAAKQLALLCVSDRDDLASAADYAEKGGDEALKRQITLACTDVKQLSEADCLTLADFYRSLPEQHSGSARPEMLRKSIGFYELFLAAHSKDDHSRLAAVLSRDAARDELEASVAAPAENSKSMDLLALVDVDRDGRSGSLKRTGKLLTGTGAFAVPVAVNGSYRLLVKFVRVSGDDGIAFNMPAGDREVPLCLSWDAGREHGIAGIGGADPNDSPASMKPGTIVNGQVHTLEVTVNVAAQNVDVSSTLDGAALLQWKGPISKLRPSVAGSLRHLIVDISPSDSATIQALSIEMLSGAARFEPAKKP